MNDSGIGVGIALGAGLVSFFTPCVLAMAPIYLGYLAGGSLAQAERTRKLDLVMRAVFFVIGFGLVFISLGIAASLFGRLLARGLPTIMSAGGVLLIAMGLHMAGLLRLPWLNTQRRLMAGRPGASGLAGSFLLGFVFGAGWSPCVGPVLAAILLLAADSQTAAQGGLLLSAYTLGLGLPFVAVAAGMSTLLPLARRMSRYSRWASVAGGVLLIVLGLAMMTGWYGVLLGALAFRI